MSAGPERCNRPNVLVSVAPNPKWAAAAVSLWCADGQWRPKPVRTLQVFDPSNRPVIFDAKKPARLQRYSQTRRGPSSPDLWPPSSEPSDRGNLKASGDSLGRGEVTKNLVRAFGGPASRGLSHELADIDPHGATRAGHKTWTEQDKRVLGSTYRTPYRRLLILRCWIRAPDDPPPRFLAPARFGQAETLGVSLVDRNHFCPCWRWWT